MNTVINLFNKAVIEEIDFSGGVIYALTDSDETVELQWSGLLKLTVGDEVYYNPNTLELHARHSVQGYSDYIKMTKEVR